MSIDAAIELMTKMIKTRSETSKSFESMDLAKEIVSKLNEQSLSQVVLTYHVNTMIIRILNAQSIALITDN